jgi:C4-dicarboxylate transporter DctM subunit
LVQTSFAGIASFPLLAMPLFMVAGNLMLEGGLSKDLVNFARMLIGRVSGGLLLATILASAFFAAISGAAVATVVAIGMIMIPTMKEAGYEEEVATAITATASCMGPIIPPSIPFILYGVIANVSIAGLFLGGAIPGLLLGFALMIYSYFLAKKRNYPRDNKTTFKDLLKAGWKALPSLLMPVIVMGGILGGIYTATEAAGVIIIYSFIVAVFFKRTFKLKQVPGVLLKSSLESAVVMLLVAFSEPFSWIIAAERVPELIVNSLLTITSSPPILLLLINILLIFIGIPLETGPAITIITPVLAPIALQLGINPIQMGIIVCFNLVLGLITPPVGAILFAATSISGIKLEKLSKAIWPPFIVSLVVLFLITYIPAFTLFLPGLFGY